MELTSVSFRIDAELKQQADGLFDSLGMSMTTAFNVFLRQSVREGRIPFEITLYPPRQETKEALLEAKRILASGKKGLPVEDALEELKKE